MSDLITFEVLFSEEQAAELHEAHERFGRRMSLREARLRNEAARLGYTLARPQHAETVSPEVSGEPLDPPPAQS